MRIWDWMRGSLLADEVDPTLEQLLPRPSPDRERVALASLGGGGMWAGLVGTAAAHKAATAAVGLSVLLGGSVAETTGVGPAVREAVQEVVTFSDDEGEGPEALVSATPAVGPAEGSNATVSVGKGNPLPGNLISQLGPNGDFQLRAEIASADGTTLLLTTPDGDLEIDIGEAEVHAAGDAAEEIVWANYLGYGVFVTGTCLDAEPAESLNDCETLQVDRVQLLGRAGQGGQPENAGKPDDAGAPDGAGQPEDAGAPEGAGQPEDVPVEAPPVEAPPVSTPPTTGRGTPQN
jgi:hypothetical protein